MEGYIDESKNYDSRYGNSVCTGYRRRILLLAVI